jgi:hypothetical protein
MESFVEIWKAMKQKRRVDVMLKEIKIEMLKRQSFAENETLSVYTNYIKMHLRK